MARNSRRKDYTEYMGFLEQVGHGQLDGVDVTHEGWPLSVAESKFISTFVVDGNLNSALKNCGLSIKDVQGKEYLINEIKWRLDQLRSRSIADETEILQYFTSVMRGEIKDQFGLDAPLSERTAAARELAKRVIDLRRIEDANVNPPEIKVTLNWDN